MGENVGKSRVELVGFIWEYVRWQICRERSAAGWLIPRALNKQWMAEKAPSGSSLTQTPSANATLYLQCNLLSSLPLPSPFPAVEITIGRKSRLVRPLPPPHIAKTGVKLFCIKTIKNRVYTTTPISTN